MTEQLSVTGQDFSSFEPEKASISRVRNYEKRLFRTITPIVIIGIVAVLAACEDKNVEISPAPSLPEGIDPLVNCGAEVELTAPGPDALVWPDLLTVDFEGKEIPKKLQELMDREEMCFWTYVPVDAETNTHHVLYVPPEKLHEVKETLDILVDDGDLLDASYEGVLR